MKDIRRYISLFLFMIITASAGSPVNAQTDESSLLWYQWDEGVSTAHKQGKKIIVEVFTARGQWSKKMDQTTYSDPTVKEFFATNFILIKLNAESDAPATFGADQITEAEVAKKFDVKEFPSTLVFDENLKLIYRIKGYIAPKEYIYFLKYFFSNSYKQMTFEQYRSVIKKGDE